MGGDKENRVGGQGLLEAWERERWRRGQMKLMREDGKVGGLEVVGAEIYCDVPWPPHLGQGHTHTH